MEYKKVSKEEFYDFIENYPTKLDFDVNGTFEPLVCTYYDLSISKIGRSIACFSRVCIDEKITDFDYHILEEYEDEE